MVPSAPTTVTPPDRALDRAPLAPARIGAAGDGRDQRIDGARELLFSSWPPPPPTAIVTRARVFRPRVVHRFLIFFSRFFLSLVFLFVVVRRRTRVLYNKPFFFFFPYYYYHYYYYRYYSSSSSSPPLRIIFFLRSSVSVSRTTARTASRRTDGRRHGGIVKERGRER